MVYERLTKDCDDYMKIKTKAYLQHKRIRQIVLLSKKKKLSEGILVRLELPKVPGDLKVSP